MRATPESFSTVLLADVVRFDDLDPTPLVALGTAFTYRRRDPWAIEMRVDNGRTWVRWLFARSLLADGLNTRAGDGDVTVFARDAAVFVLLSNPDDCDVTLRFDRADVERILDRCDQVVPEGDETKAVDWDRELARLGEAA
ncbi:SsgA family sporulation/cell division regulator [Amycolatopsis sp. CA-230715]|uniref:SsgA family sporulation/cell division regulator n=1 Tax=Amycolatopsis sp. CA-230715 TaxID=2745196 RepID=UPI001C00DA84|nr:SsgA family sporulation/cell division regulator [Amycolatopsis sp. CA-230715]QWF80452.1 hypothetical protein HUW46_03874 [Amycolatopsis sp. CA-230715]